MARCSFCGTTIPEGTGKVYVKIDGKKLNFCSTKCEKNMLLLKRKARNLKWTEVYREEKEKGMKK